MTAAQTLREIAGACGGQLPLPPRGDEQVFAEPWQAQVFAITVLLHEREAFSWDEWAAALGRRVAGGKADGTDYYEQWVAALGDLLDAKGVVGSDEIAVLTKQWQASAARTPHGRPIELDRG